MHSTTTSLLHVADHILHSFDHSIVSTLVALDFSKVFDTINYQLLLAKLHHYGLSKSALSLFRSFLSSRSQSVVIYNLFPIFSSSRIVPSRVPQRSVLDPLLFSIFTADFFSILRCTAVHVCCANDVLVKSFTPSDAASVSAILNHDLQLIANWSASCGLLLNPTKSLSLLVGSSVLLSRTRSFTVSFNSIPLVTPSSLGSSVYMSILHGPSSTISLLNVEPFSHASVFSFFFVIFSPSPKNFTYLNCLSSLYLTTSTLFIYLASASVFCIVSNVSKTRAFISLIVLVSSIISFRCLNNPVG